MANLEAICASLAPTGELARFPIFVLSDSTDADAWVAEEAAVLALRDRLGETATVYYRHRVDNVDLKAGNVADWVRRFGAPYAHFVVLDADSVMDGATLIRLAAAMEHDPHMGVIQTIPVVVGGATLFARLQQFAARAYGPVITSGLAWWHGADGNYWGHNAIVRTSAFAEAAGLPHLKGRRPFGGQVMSHDFIEAALVRRAGWAVQLAPALQGSYEESPPSLVDLATRDRRWCQGNLQHVALLQARGFHAISRLHLLTGIFAYLSSPLWLAFLLVGMLASLQAHFVRTRRVGDVLDVFRQLPAQDAQRATRLFIIIMIVLITPKLVALAVLLLNRAARRGCGGAPRAVTSVLLETIFSALIAPIMMLTQSRAVASVLAGRDAGWKAQRRDGVITLREIVHRHLWHTLFGIAMGAVAWLVAPSLFLWMSPVVIGLVLAIPISALSARRSTGRVSRRLGLFRTPEETAPPPVLLEAAPEAAPLPAVETEAVARLVADPRLLTIHRADLATPRCPANRSTPISSWRALTLEEAASIEAIHDLTPRQKLVALTDPLAIARAVGLTGPVGVPPAAS